MSAFTRFNNRLLISFDMHASLELHREYWRIEQSFRYYIGDLNSNRWVDVKAGKLTDGATIPWPVSLLLPPWGQYGQAVAVHDQLCDTYLITELVDGVETQVPIDRKEIDAILKEAMRVLKVPKWKQVVIGAGVDIYRLAKRPTEPEHNPLKQQLETRYGF